MPAPSRHLAKTLLLAWSVYQSLMPIHAQTSSQTQETTGAHSFTFDYGTPEQAGFRAAGLDSVRGMMQQAVRDSVFPGAVLLVGRRGIVVLHEAFGKFGYPPFD